MDDFSIQDERIDQALKELQVANKYLGGISTTKEGLNYLIDRRNHKNLSVLDVGAGASDILQYLSNNFHVFNIAGFDLNKRTCRILRAKSIKNIICADSLNIPIKEKQFDVIHASLFFHHFTEEQIKKMISEFLKISRTGIIINDLRRTVFALLGIKIISSLFSKSEMFKNDGPLSVRRGFEKSDWVKILSEIGIDKIYNKEKMGIPMVAGNLR